MTKRREFLAATGTAAIAGCLGGSPTKARVQFITEVPLLEPESQWGSAPFTATVFDTPADANAGINDEVSYIDDIERYLQFNPDDEFLAVLTSTLRLIDEGEDKGWCPNPSINEDQLVFQIPLDEWPDPLEESANWVVLYVRRLSSFENAPSRASVSIEFPPDSSRRCSD